MNSFYAFYLFFFDFVLCEYLKCRLQDEKKREEEERAKLAREKLKERRVVEDIAPAVTGPLLEEGKNDAYGKWQTVKAV